MSTTRVWSRTTGSSGPDRDEESMSGGPDLRENAGDETRMIALQQQIDELRGIVRELMARQARGDELFKSHEMALGQVRAGVEQQRHETTQTLQTHHLDDQRLRQQLTDLDARVDGFVRPLRSIQAHVSELGEALRRGREEADKGERRFDELRPLIDHIAAQTERNASVVQAARESIEGLRAELDETRRGLQLSEDAIKIVEQDFRRRIAEVSQESLNASARIDELPAIFDRHAVAIEDMRDSIAHLDPLFDALGVADARLQEKISRFAAQSAERDDLIDEQIDEIRRQIQTQWYDLRQSTDQRDEWLGQRLGDLDDIDRELASRTTALETRIEETRELSGQLRRELWVLHESRSRMRLEQAQAELESVADARRATEQELAPERREAGT